MILNKNNNKNNKNKNTHRERKIWRARKFCQTFSAARRSSALHHRPRACPGNVLLRGIPHGVRSRDGHISSLTHFFRGATRHIQIRHLQNLLWKRRARKRRTGTSHRHDPLGGHFLVHGLNRSAKKPDLKVTLKVRSGLAFI